MANSLVIPIVLWGQKPPTHQISAIFVSHQFQNIITGCRDGQLIIWDYAFDTCPIPKCMLFGHTSSVISITPSEISGSTKKQQHVITASESGELCLWDITSGHCIEHVVLPGSPTQISCCDFAFGNELHKCIMVLGQFSEISIIDPSTLNVILTLASKIFPDWISCAVVLSSFQPVSTCNVIGLTVSGMFKVWHIHSMSSPDVLFEEESKQISCPTAIDMKLSKSNRGLLIVCSNVWLICDAGDYSILCLEKAEIGLQWLGGDFLSTTCVILWNRVGDMYLYKLPFNSTNQESFRTSLQNQKKLVPQLLKKVSLMDCQHFLLPPAITVHKTDSSSYIVIGTFDGILSVADISEQGLKPASTSSLKGLWNSLKEKPVGIFDQYNPGDSQPINVTSTLFITNYSFVCCGREDGSILISSAVKSCCAHLLLPEEGTKKSVPPFKLLQGHKDRVTCLLYPFQEAPDRYTEQVLVSGSADFSVILWDLLTGTMTHSFHIHGGELSQLIIPPYGCNPRISQSICSVANDHSVALLNVRDRKCFFMASRHPSPISLIRWRPLDDFLLILCADSSLYVWQMETGHLDRFEQGALAVEIINACDEADINTANTSHDSVNLSQALKSKSLTLFKAVAQQGLRSLIESLEPQKQKSYLDKKIEENVYKAMLISPLRASPLHDCDSHIIFINTEALIARLLLEHSLRSKSQLKNVKSGSDPNLNYKNTTILNFLKQVKSQLLDEDSDVSSPDITGKRQKKSKRLLHIDSAIDIAQIVISCLHAWELDGAIDKLCKEKLGLLVPRYPVCFGSLSQHGHMALFLPSSVDKKKGNLSHWQMSNSLTTQHLISIISIANTMMELPHAFFKSAKIKKRYTGYADSDDAYQDDASLNDQSQVKQSWSLLATLHCVLLPDKMTAPLYKPPKLQLLARRWQDRCLELREAAQALMLAELRQMGPEGRRKVVEIWSNHVPDYVYQPTVDAPQIDSPSYMATDEVGDRTSAASDELLAVFPSTADMSNEARRRHATAIVILGVIGAEFGQELDPSGAQRHDVPEGFGLSDYSLARHTCKALVYLLLQPPSQKLPAHVPIRRAAIDLLGRGFTVWEPYMEVSAVLLGLLELCESYHKHIGTIQSGFPLASETDSCRSAHHSLSLIATARPLTFITTIAREVARYNAAAANPQHQSLLATSVLVRSKPEVLRIIELLADKMTCELLTVLVEVVDIVLFCIDVSVLRASYGLLEAVPALAKFHTISYDARSRRVAVASGQGSIVLYEIRSCKHQTIPRGPGSITALCFSPDGKYLAVYCALENQLSFWVTATSLFGMLQSQVKCVKTLTPLKVLPKSFNDPTSHTVRINLSKLVWVNNRSVVLLTPDGAEHRFHV